MADRLANGGRIDRQTPLAFTFNGQPMSGYAGDTVASALLANGVRIVSRSFKYHRPRGIIGIGAEETNAIFSVGDGAHRTPNVRSTLTPLTDGMIIRSQSGWPSLNFDIGGMLSTLSRFLPAGFYYKTFMSPARLWPFYEKIIRRAASSAKSPDHEDPAQYLHRHLHCDVLVVGSGPAGLSAATNAAKAGARVVIAEMDGVFGGHLQDDDISVIDGVTATQWIADTVAALGDMKTVTLLANTTIQGYHDYNYLIGVQRFGNESPRQCLLKIRAKQVVLATGTIERPLVFAGNDSPGIMSAAAVRAYINRYGVLPSRRILFLTNNDSAYAAAITAAKAGAEVEIADLRDNDGSYWQQQAVIEKIPVRRNTAIISARQNGESLTVQLGNFSSNETASPYASHAYSMVAVSGGWTPTVHLFSQARGTLAWNDRIGAFCPANAHPQNPCLTAGSVNGNFDLSQCLQEGAQTGVDAACACGHSRITPTYAETAPPALEQLAIFPAYLPALHSVGRGPSKHFVDLMNDVTAADILLSVREGYQSVEHMKRYTAAGFGTDQGKTGNINALKILAKALKKTPEAIGHTTYRPHYTPTAFGVITGSDRKDTFAQARQTPIDDWHRRHNAVYEHVGDWLRPRYFPRGNESMDDAVWRECNAARNAVAIMDATTLGKIDIRGKDAAKFLDMLYTNAFSSLAAGRCRYGLMLRETGMIFDDGVTARLDENHYHMTTSTGNAAAVLTWMEEWLQTEWPDLQVFCTSVTEQWTVISLAGPKAREVLSSLTDIQLTTSDFPFMSFKQGIVAGAPARVFRVSFSGEIAFEINVPARYGLSVWESIFAAGEAHGITPYGTEAMHVLRAEKGFIIVGQDSDGTMTPHDMGLSWMISKKKDDFLGRRSLSRPDMQRSGRLQLVGLLPTDPKAVIPEGAQIIRETDATPQGHVTSSYMSPTLERSFALAMISDGTTRHGEKINTVFLDGRQIPAIITDTVFWDKDGERLRG